jgi:hypothetical protein
LQVDQDYLGITAEFPQYLAARSTGRRGSVTIGGDRDAPKIPHSVRYGFEYGDAFGTDRQTVSCILDVASREDPAITGRNRRSYFEVGKRCMRVFPHRQRSLNQ